MYSLFAQYYDRLIANVDYGARADYFCAMIRKHSSVQNGLLLDLCCGTGNLAFPLADRGWDVIGVDGSEEMLSLASQKLMEYTGERRPMFLCQQMQELDLYGTVDICICALDSINHVTDIREIERVFQRLSLFIESGGLFIFDANTLYKHSKVLDGSTFVYDEDDVYCVWQNSPCVENTVDISLDFFEPIGDNKYRRYNESFSERAYTTEEFLQAGKKAGFELISVYHADSFSPPRPDSERLVYVMENMTEHRPYIANDITGGTNLG